MASADKRPTPTWQLERSWLTLERSRNGQASSSSLRRHLKTLEVLHYEHFHSYSQSTLRESSSHTGTFYLLRMAEDFNILPIHSNIKEQQHSLVINSKKEK